MDKKTSIKFYSGDYNNQNLIDNRYNKSIEAKEEIGMIFRYSEEILDQDNDSVDIIKLYDIPVKQINIINARIEDIAKKILQPENPIRSIIIEDNCVETSTLLLLIKAIKDPNCKVFEFIAKGMTIKKDSNLDKILTERRLSKGYAAAEIFYNKFPEINNKNTLEDFEVPKENDIFLE